MNKALRDVLARDDIRAQLIKVGATARTSTPEELRQHVVNEIAKWSEVREKAGIEQRE
jgi:tripartite-type tricarboxylate transporter receptor subunit TctC